MSDTTIFKKFEKELDQLREEMKGKDSLQIIYDLQCALMKRLGHEPTWLKQPYIEYPEQEIMTENGIEKFPRKFEANQKEMRTQILLQMVHALDSEVSEFRDELPWKGWRKYYPEDLWHENEEKRWKAGFELGDILFFDMESFITAGFSFEDILMIYMVKWLENMHRQNKGYDNNYVE